MHYIQGHYVVDSTHARFRWVIRFARNILIARALGYRVVWTVHDESPAFPLRPKWVEDLAYLLVARLSHSVIVHCEYARSMIRERYGRTYDVATVSHPSLVGVYSTDVTPALARSRMGLDDRDIVFLCFGQIRPNKGIERLLMAFSRLDSPHLKLVVAGAPGPDIAYVRKLERIAQTDPRILYLDRHVPDHSVAEIFSAADVAVMSFAQVLTSSSVILAMSLGKPVIAPSRGCISDLVSSGVGWAYCPEDPSALELALLAATTADLPSMGARARMRAAQTQLSDVASQTLKAYGMLP